MVSVPTLVRDRTRDRSLIGPLSDVPAIPAVPAVRTATAQTVQVGELRLWPVARIAAAFWGTVALVGLLSVVGVWLFASATGFVGDLEELAGDMLGDPNFQIVASSLFRLALGAALLFAAVATVATVVAVALYNTLTRAAGRLELDVLTRDQG